MVREILTVGSVVAPVGSQEIAIVVPGVDEGVTECVKCRKITSLLVPLPMSVAVAVPVAIPVPVMAMVLAQVGHDESGSREGEYESKTDDEQNGLRLGKLHGRCSRRELRELLSNISE